MGGPNLFPVVLAFATLALVAGPLTRRLGPAAFLILAIGPALGAIHASVVAGSVLAGTPLVERIEWIPEFGIALALRMDALSWLLAMVATVVGALVLVYCARYFGPGEPGLGRFAAVLTAFAGAMYGLVLADDVFLLLAFWEATSVLSYLLISHRSTLKTSRGASLQALLVTTLGGLAMLVGLILLVVETGATTLTGIIAAAPDGTLVVVAVLLVLVGALSKSALFPFHFWLPAAMAAPTPVSAYLHAAAMVKAGIYLVARLAPGFAELPGFRITLIGLGIITLLLGAVLSLRQTDLKLVLAYGTVSQLGLLVTVLALGTREAGLAGLTLLLGHALAKAALFLVVGIIDHRTGTRDLRKLSGLGRVAPTLAVVGVLAAASMISLPPLIGFLGKETMFAAFVDAGIAGETWGWIALVGTALGSVLTVAYTARFIWGAFATKRGVEATRVTGTPVDFLLAPGLLALAGLAAGFAGPSLERWFGGYTETLPPAALEPAHLALWHGWGPALALSAGVLALGAVVAVGSIRSTRRALRAEPERRYGAQDVYNGVLAGIDVLAARATAMTQRGSLPFYLAVILGVFIAGVGVALAMNRSWPETLRAWDSPWQLVIAAVMITSAIAATRAVKRFQLVILVGVTGYGLVVLFATLGAPDLALTQALVELVTLVAMVLVLRRLPARLGEANGSRRPVLRAIIGVGFGAVMAVVAVVALASRQELPVSVDWPYLAETGGHGLNVVNVALVDLRGWDTMGELSVIIAAATGVASLVFVSTRDDTLPRLTRIQMIREARAQRLRAADPDIDERGAWLPSGVRVAQQFRTLTLEVVVRFAFHAIIVISLFVLLAGHNAPGGGFAAGLIAGMALVARYLAGGRHELGAAAPVAAGVLLGAGMLLAAGTATVPLIFGADALTSTWFAIDLGAIGTIDFVTSSVFDIGVYLVVIGLVLDVLRSLGAEVDHHADQHDEAVASR
ncbi:MAG TPA: Na+/H+ antiporter subunit A [Microbacteriaceae bacterium]|nr:Na+/H+ antiporter subunit A [Microbacteriaceae bacterium]